MILDYSRLSVVLAIATPNMDLYTVDMYANWLVINVHGTCKYLVVAR